MIPYDDLVAALASWRARQGLPTGQLAGSPTPAPPPTPAAAPKPSAQAAPQTGRGAAPAGRPTPVTARAATPVGHGHEDSVDVDDAALLEESSYDSDFAMSFNDDVGESTAIGTAPAPPRRGGR